MIGGFNGTMIVEIELPTGLILVLLFVVVVLTRKGEAECVEGLDECLQEWETIKEKWD